MSQQINLFDADLRTRRTPLDAATMAIALAMFVAALLGYQQYEKRQLAAAQSRAESADVRLKQLQTTVTQLAGSAKRTPNKALEEQVARAEENLKTAHQLLQRLEGSGIGNAAGHAHLLEALARQHTEGVWLTHISVSESGDFALQGKMLRPDLMGGYIQQLNRDQSLRGRAIGHLNIAEIKEDPAFSAGKEAKGNPPRSSPGGRSARPVEFSITSTSASEAAQPGGGR